jgi:sortase A
MKNNTKKKEGKCFALVGIILRMAVVVLLLYNLWDECRAGMSSENVLLKIDSIIPAVEDVPDHASSASTINMSQTYERHPNMEMPVATLDGHDYIGRIDIPSLNLSLPVMSEWSSPNLKISPCRYSGSAYLDNMIIEAHNYQRHFGNLKTLNIGSKIIFTDMDGNRFDYEVAKMEQLDPDDTQQLKEGNWALTLFTYAPSRQYRVTVRCVRTTGDV